MSLDRAKILLEKIETLHRSISMDSDGVNRIERDLMLNYLRQVYDIYLDLDTEKAPPPLRSTPPPPPKEAAPTPEPTPTPTPEPEPPAPASPANEYVPAPPPPPAAPPAPQPEAKPPAPVPAAEPPAIVSIPPALSSLFEQKAARELSEKLGQRPVQDLTKAMAINDRLLYANSLFQGDSRVMNNILTELNSQPDFAAAQRILVDLAKQYDWAAEPREEVAKSFIKLVRRRWAS
jgi:hypothetical protein